jgi:type IV fimbrial biogenesis protein FimT
VLGRRLQRGVSLIEVMIMLAVVAVLMMLGLPAYSTWVQNSQLRSAAESLAGGLRAARSEALQRNRNVEFVLTSDEPIAANVNSLTPTAGGRSWVVRIDTDPDPLVSTYTFLQGKSGAEGSTNAGIASGTSTVVFTPLGRTTLAAAATFSVTNAVGGSCVADGGEMRCLNVVVSTGGQVKMCDPAVAGAGDTRAC